MSETEGLLPCPFCGGEAEIVQIGNDATPKRGFEVRCLKWGCATKKRALVIRQPTEKAREYAIAAWNTRPQPAGAGAREILAAAAYNDGCRESTRDDILKGIECYDESMRIKVSAALRAVEAALRSPGVGVSAADAFDMGYAWAQGLTGQTLEDSRAVGRTLGQDIFDPISERITAILQRDGFDSFKDANDGIYQAKRIIRAALAPKDAEAPATPQKKDGR